MKIHVYAHSIEPGRGGKPELAAALEGFRRHGLEPEVRAISKPGACDLAVCWGVKRRLVYASGRRTLVLERGYVGDRMKTWTSAGFDGLNGLADFRNKPCPDNGYRWNRHHADQMKPRHEQTAAKHVLIMGQVHGDASLRGLKPGLWAREVAAQLILNGHHVAYRPHPLWKSETGLPRVLQLPATMPFAEALDMAKWVVTFNSNAGVLSALAGVPTVAMDTLGGSMAHDVTTRNPLLRPLMPDRTDWAHRLAWAQWTTEELASGDMWEHLKGGMEAQRAVA